MRLGAHALIIKNEVHMPKGLEISKKYFETCLPVLKQCIPDIMEHAATGLAGE